MKPDAGGGEAGVEDESRREAWPGQREEERTGQRADLYSRGGGGGCGRSLVLAGQGFAEVRMAWRGCSRGGGDRGSGSCLRRGNRSGSCHGDGDGGERSGRRRVEVG